ncbi:uncharacterized protein LOC143038745 [Oratosquilla oratoria]|uniref:uncharacterized protein LOC143038745 n=1 Tax=Oratosquilla oratoria TaxID=337810 RepID=UPI003F7573CC
MAPNNLNATLIASPCPVCNKCYCPSNPLGRNLPSSPNPPFTFAVPALPSAQQPGFRRKLPPRLSRSSKMSLEVVKQPCGSKSSSLDLPPRVIRSPSNGLRRQKRIVDFVRFSDDVKVLKVALPFGGTLRIKDRRLRTLLVTTSSTGDFLLRDPLEVQAGKDYRLYLTSPATAEMQLHRGLWEAKSGSITAEWGNTTIPDGLHLWVSR